MHRLLIAIPTLLGVSLLIFIAMRVLPGDPLAAISGEGGGSYILSQEQLRAARASLGLDRPYAVQYLDWLKDVLRGDLGKSFWRGEPIRELILRRGPITAQIALMAVMTSWLKTCWSTSATAGSIRASATNRMARFFRSSPLGGLCALLLLLLATVAILADRLAPYNPLTANSTPSPAIRPSRGTSWAPTTWGGMC